METTLDGCGVRKAERAELLFGQAGLLQDLSKRSSGQSAGVHCDVGLAAICVAEDFVASALPYFRETGSKKPREDIMGGVRHRRFRSG